MIRMLIMTLAILISTTTSVSATSDLTQEQFLQGTGSSCLAGGILVGLAALAAGPAVASAMATPVASTSLTAGSATLIGCGASAVAAVSYYGVTWIYGTLFGQPRYPLLYPPMETRQ